MSDATLAELRAAFSELMGAERRFRGRGPARPGELSNAQIRALWGLKHGEECTSGAIAKRAELSPASVTAMLDQLEREGMVTRHRSEQDRRQVIVSLTDAGHAALEAKRASWEGHWLEGLAEHSEADLETAVRVIRSMARMLDGVGATPAKDGGSHPVQSA
jgi:MarR family transcriptional regulator, organic hydroperoxide resistance regulator